MVVLPGAISGFKKHSLRRNKPVSHLAPKNLKAHSKLIIMFDVRNKHFKHN